MSSFKKNFRKYLKEMIPKEHDDYKELKFNEYIFLHVWSADEGEGYFELELIIPHKEDYKTAEEGGTLDEVPEFGSFLKDLKEILSDETNKVESAVNFQHMETYEEGETGSLVSIQPAHDVYYGSVIEVE